MTTDLGLRVLTDDDDPADFDLTLDEDATGAELWWRAERLMEIALELKRTGCATVGQYLDRNPATTTTYEGTPE
jgi:hypothetical protein